MAINLRIFVPEYRLLWNAISATTESMFCGKYQKGPATRIYDYTQYAQKLFHEMFETLTLYNRL